MNSRPCNEPQDRIDFGNYFKEKAAQPVSFFFPLFSRSLLLLLVLSTRATSMVSLFSVLGWDLSVTLISHPPSRLDFIWEKIRPANPFSVVPPPVICRFFESKVEFPRCGPLPGGPWE